MRARGVAAAGAAVAAVALVGRRRRSGPAEVLPGDSLVPAPRYQTTRTIEIAAAPESVWPWLVQIGQGRGGFYSYDLLENLLGLGIHSAHAVLPELQSLAVGDTISLDPEDQLPMAVVELEPARRLVLRGGRPAGRPRRATTSAVASPPPGRSCSSPSLRSARA